MTNESRADRMAAAYRTAFAHVEVDAGSGRWTCWVTGLTAPCGCFACNAAARRGCAAADAIRAGGAASDFSKRPR